MSNALNAPAGTLDNILREDYSAPADWRPGRWNPIEAKAFPRLAVFVNTTIALRSFAASNGVELSHRGMCVTIKSGHALELGYKGLRFRIHLAPGCTADAGKISAGQVVKAEWTYKKPKVRIVVKRGPRKPQAGHETAASLS